MHTSTRRSVRFAPFLSVAILALAPATAFAGPGDGTPSSYDQITVQRGVTPDPGLAAWESQATAPGQGVTPEPGFAAWAAQIVAAVIGSTS